jgi:hypothetical protein
MKALKCGTFWIALSAAWLGIMAAQFMFYAIGVHDTVWVSDVYVGAFIGVWVGWDARSM